MLLRLRVGGRGSRIYVVYLCRWSGSVGSPFEVVNWCLWRWLASPDSSRGGAALVGVGARFWAMGRVAPQGLLVLVRFRRAMTPGPTDVPSTPSGSTLL